MTVKRGTRIITADDIVRGAMKSRRPKVRFPGLSLELEHQARSLVSKYEETHTRRAASPFVRSILSRRWKP